MMDKSWVLEQRASSSNKDKMSWPSGLMEHALSELEEKKHVLAKKRKVLCPSGSMEHVLGEQEERIHMFSKKHKRPSGSMAEVISDLEETTSSPCLTPSAPQPVNHDDYFKKRKVSWPSGSTKHVFSEQEERIPMLSKKQKCPRGSMAEVINNLEDTASSPCLLASAPQLINHDGSTGKKKRGLTKCLKTHGLRDEERLPVKLNTLGQPIGCHRATLSTYLGTLARNAHLTPLTYTSWKGLKHIWKDLWETVTSKFDIEERAKKWVLQTICSSWRTHKCRLKKKYFKPNMTDGYNIKNRPPIVPLEQWKILIKYWKLDMAKVHSEKNKISRAKFTSIHTTGSKTFAEIRDEETIRNVDGREPSRVEMYLMTHKPKNENPMNKSTNRIVSEFEDMIALHPEISEQSTSQDDLFSQVLGKDRHGYVRTYGKGVVPSDLWGTKSQVEIEKVIADVKRNAQAEIQILQERMQEEMEVKLNKQMEAIKKDFFGGFNTILTQLQKHFPKIVLPNLFSIPNTNVGQAVDERSCATTHHAHIEKQSHSYTKSKKGKEDKTQDKRCEKEIQIVKNHIEVRKEIESESKEHKAKGITTEKEKEKKNQSTGERKKRSEEKTHDKKQSKTEIQVKENLVELQKQAESKTKEHKPKRVTSEKDPNMLRHPPTAFSLFWERFRKDCKEVDLDSENNPQRIHMMAVMIWKSMTNEDKKVYLDKAAKLKTKHEKYMAKRGQEKGGAKLNKVTI